MSREPASQYDGLIEAAERALEYAYAPYSGFAVGAAVLTGSGNVYDGCNVENASYGLTVCAERVAIFKAVSEGERTIVALAVVADSKDVVRPCGACLQVIKEFAKPDSSPLIIAANLRGLSDVQTLAEYLPLPFVL